MEILWLNFFINPIFNLDSSKFMSLLYKSTEYNKNPYNLILNEECILYLFNKILCNPKKMNYATMTEKSYECFELYFKYANDLAKNITLRG